MPHASHFSPYCHVAFLLLTASFTSEKYYLRLECNMFKELLYSSGWGRELVSFSGDSGWDYGNIYYNKKVAQMCHQKQPCFAKASLTRVWNTNVCNEDPTRIPHWCDSASGPQPPLTQSQCPSILMGLPSQRRAEIESRQFGQSQNSKQELCSEREVAVWTARLLRFIFSKKL